MVMLISGCSSIGPAVIEGNRVNYNIAVQKTNDEEMLLNLVRLKYRDTPLFLEISSLSSQMSVNGSIGMKMMLRKDKHEESDATAGFGYADKPTMTFTPLFGNKFIRSMLTPVTLDTLGFLFNSGWSAERLFSLCVQQINNVKNAPSASGPTPDYVPAYREYRRGMKLLREMQRNDIVDIVYENDRGTIRPALIFAEHALLSPNVIEFKKIFGLAAGIHRFFLTMDRRTIDPAYIRITSRPLLGIMFFLSQSVQVSADDVKLGLVTTTVGNAGKLFDWLDVVGHLMHIHSQPSKPQDMAAVSVKYRNKWFYIKDSDLNSKSTFSLVNQLFYLQAGDIKAVAPLLTLPIGN